jgi:hypothetical protein
MNAMDWFVIVGGLAAITWINWYFFLSQRRMVPVDRPEHRNVVARSSGAKTKS